MLARLLYVVDGGKGIDPLTRRSVPSLGGKPKSRGNTDQGSQFSSAEFVAAVKACGAQQSMDGKECWRDNVFVERLWRSVKYEEVYLKACDSFSAARLGLAGYCEFYNSRRPHQSLDGQTPDMVYFNSLQPVQAAA